MALHCGLDHSSEGSQRDIVYFGYLAQIQIGFSSGHGIKDRTRWKEGEGRTNHRVISSTSPAWVFFNTWCQGPKRRMKGEEGGLVFSFVFSFSFLRVSVSINVHFFRFLHFPVTLFGVKVFPILILIFVLLLMLMLMLMLTFVFVSRSHPYICLYSPHPNFLSFFLSFFLHFNIILILLKVRFLKKIQFPNRSIKPEIQERMCFMMIHSWIPKELGEMQTREETGFLRQRGKDERKRKLWERNRQNEMRSLRLPKRHVVALSACLHKRKTLWRCELIIVMLGRKKRYLDFSKFTPGFFRGVSSFPFWSLLFSLRGGISIYMMIAPRYSPQPSFFLSFFFFWFRST